MENWVKEIIDSSAGPTLHMQRGRKYRLDGKPCLITGGSYYGDLFGRPYGICNFWYWNPIQADGSLGVEEHGYGYWKTVKELDLT